MKELKKIWKKQLKFNSNFFDFRSASSEERQQHTKEIILHLISEADEVLRECNWKMHRKKSLVVREDKMREEIIDVFKYCLTLAQIWNIKPEQFVEEFYRKSDVVEQKYKQEFKLSLMDDNMVVGIDIDGVLAEYPEGFIKFIEKKTKIDLSKIKITSYNLYNIIGDVVGVEKMKKLKHEFRMSGEKRNLDCIKGARQSMVQLKKKGYRLILLSARPYKEYPRIFADTIEWLNKNKIPFDAILWDENKEQRILREFPKLNFFVEDCLSNAEKISSLNKKVYLIDKTYNQGEINKNIIRVKGWKEIMEDLK